MTRKLEGVDTEKLCLITEICLRSLHCDILVVNMYLLVTNSPPLSRDRQYIDLGAEGGYLNGTTLATDASLCSEVDHVFEVGFSDVNMKGFRIR